MPNTFAASPRKVASPITSTMSARPARSSGVDDAGAALARADPNADFAPRHIHAAHGSGRSGVARVRGSSVVTTRACLDEDEAAFTAGAAVPVDGADAGAENDEWDDDDAEEVSGATVPGAGSGASRPPVAGGGSGFRPCARAVVAAIPPATRAHAKSPVSLQIAFVGVAASIFPLLSTAFDIPRQRCCQTRNSPSATRRPGQRPRSLLRAQR